MLLCCLDWVQAEKNRNDKRGVMEEYGYASYTNRLSTVEAWELAMSHGSLACSLTSMLESRGGAHQYAQVPQRSAQSALSQNLNVSQLSIALWRVHELRWSHSWLEEERGRGAVVVGKGQTLRFALWDYLVAYKSVYKSV